MLSWGRTLGGHKITAGQLWNPEVLEQLVRNKQAYKFLKNVRGSPAYWQDQLCDVLAMLWTISIPTCSSHKVAHLYSATGSMWLSYLQNALHYLSSRATPPNFGVKIPGSNLHTHVGWGLTCLPSNAIALPVLIYTWVGWSLINLKQGSAQPKLPQFWLWSVSNPQPLTHEPRTIPLCHWGLMVPNIVCCWITLAWNDSSSSCTVWEEIITKRCTENEHCRH